MSELTSIRVEDPRVCFGWNNLPRDVLRLINHRLPAIQQVRNRRVCREWRDALPRQVIHWDCPNHEQLRHHLNECTVPMYQLRRLLHEERVAGFHFCLWWEARGLLTPQDLSK